MSSVATLQIFTASLQSLAVLRVPRNLALIVTVNESTDNIQ